MFCCTSRKHANQSKESPIRCEQEEVSPDGQVKMLICAMDYKQTDNPLSCTVDGKNMAQLAQQSGLVDLKVMTDEGAGLTREMAFEAMEGMLSTCASGDTFVFYYSGHGTQLEDVDDATGEESDAEDDAYCFQTAAGKINYESCWTDDKFAEQITGVIPDGVNVLIVSDCCHSDTICDFSKPIWNDINAISISGCLDSQTSGDTGQGGICTHSILLAVDILSQAVAEGKVDGDYSVGYLFNTTLKQKKKNFPDAEQKLSIEHSPNTDFSAIRWPLIPRGTYNAPLHKKDEGPMSYGAPGASMTYGAPGASTTYAAPPAVLNSVRNLADCGKLGDDDLP